MFEKVKEIIADTLSCEMDDVTIEARLTEEAGMRRCVPLQVSGPFRTLLTAPVAEELHGRFET